MHTCACMCVCMCMCAVEVDICSLCGYLIQSIYVLLYHYKVESQRIELLNHPIVTKLLDHKWKSFGRTFYFVNMTTYLIFLVFLTAFGLISPTPNSTDCELKFLL